LIVCIILILDFIISNDSKNLTNILATIFQISHKKTTLSNIKKSRFLWKDEKILDLEIMIMYIYIVFFLIYDIFYYNWIYTYMKESLLVEWKVAEIKTSVFNCSLMNFIQKTFEHSCFYLLLLLFSSLLDV